MIQGEPSIGATLKIPDAARTYSIGESKAIKPGAGLIIIPTYTLAISTNNIIFYQLANNNIIIYIIAYSLIAYI